MTLHNPELIIMLWLWWWSFCMFSGWTAFFLASHTLPSSYYQVNVVQQTLASMFGRIKQINKILTAYSNLLHHHAVFLATARVSCSTYMPTKFPNSSTRLLNCTIFHYLINDRSIRKCDKAKSLRASSCRIQRNNTVRYVSKLFKVLSKVL